MKGCLISLDTLSPWLKVVDWIPCIVASVLCVCVCVSLWGGGERMGRRYREEERVMYRMCVSVCVCVCVCVCVFVRAVTYLFPNRFLWRFSVPNESVLIPYTHVSKPLPQQPALSMEHTCNGETASQDHVPCHQYGIEFRPDSSDRR